MAASKIELLTIEEVASILCISVHTARNRLSRGDSMPPHLKFGRRVLFPKDKLTVWLEDKVEM